MTSSSPRSLLPGKSIALWVGVAFAAACGLDDSSVVSVGPVVSDSAGVRIVVNRVPATGIPSYATVDPEPELELRGTGGDAPLPWRSVVGVRTGRDGTVAVADAANRQVTFHSSEGGFIAAVRGAAGSFGFRELEGLGVTDAGFWAFDDAGRRLVSLVDGRAVGAVDAPPTGEIVGRFGDGSVLLRTAWSLAIHRADPIQGVRRDSALWLRWWPETGDTASVGPFPFDETLVVRTDSLELYGLPAFGRATSAVTGPGRLYVGDQVTFEIRGLDPNGALREIIRLEGVDLTLTPEQVRMARPARTEEVRDTPDWVDRFWDAAPETRPAYTRLLLDRLGNLWVAEHVAVRDTPRNWMVFGADGVLRGLVEVPRGFVPWEIGADYLLGAGTDPDGTVVVRRHALSRER